MRTNEERIAAMHRRAAELEREERRKKAIILETISIAACLALVVTLSFLMPGYVVEMTHPGMNSGMYASIFSNNSMLSYLVVGIVAFLLGSAVTLFCFRLNKWQDDENHGSPGEKSRTKSADSR